MIGRSYNWKGTLKGVIDDAELVRRSYLCNIKKIFPAVMQTIAAPASRREPKDSREGQQFS